MKFKALKSFVSGLGTFDADKEYDVKLDKPTLKMWIEHGLIEEVKVSETVKPQETTEAAQSVQEPTQKVEEVKPVETDENK